MITSIGINKTSKKFAPKVKPKTKRDKKEDQTENKEAEASEVVADKVGESSKENTNISAINTTKLDSKIVIDNDSERSNQPVLNQEKSSKMSIPKTNIGIGAKKISVNNKENAIATSREKEDINKTLRREERDEGDEEDDSDKPFDIMASFNSKAVKEINKVMEDPNISKNFMLDPKIVDLVNEFMNGEPNPIVQPNADLNDLLQHKLDIIGNSSNKDEMNQKAKYAIKQLNSYRKERKVDMDKVPISALCAPNIAYGEKMVEEKGPKKRVPIPTPQNITPKVNETLIKEKKSRGTKMKLVDGKLSLDKSSLNVAFKDLSNESNEPLERVDYGEATHEGTSHKYFTKYKSIKWSEEETDLFYRGLVKWGIDFEMITNEFFKGTERERRHIKLKFNKEDRENSLKVTEALVHKRYTPLISSSESDIKQDGIIHPEYLKLKNKTSKKRKIAKKIT